MRNKFAKVSDPNKFESNPGERDRIIYSAKISPNGVIEVVPTGKEDYQAYIESFRSSTDIAYILKQLSLGDTSVLNKSAPQFGDFTQMPSSLAEAMQLQIDAEKQFYQLPIDTRQKFNNNFREWCFTAGTDEWIEKMNLKQENKMEGEVEAPAE